MYPNTNSKSKIRPVLKLCKHLTGKTTGLMALSSAVLYAVAGPAGVILPVVIWGIDSYSFFSNAQIEEQIETALKARNIDQLNTLQSGFNKRISEIQIECLLFDSLRNKDKKTLQWIADQGYKPSTETVLAAYKQLPHQVFLETLSFWIVFQVNIIPRTFAVYSMINNIPDLLKTLLSLECYRFHALTALSNEYINTRNESEFLEFITMYDYRCELDIAKFVNNLDEQRQIGFLKKVLSVFESKGLPVSSLLLKFINNPFFQQFLLEYCREKNNLSLTQSLFDHCWHSDPFHQYPHLKKTRAHLLEYCPKLLDDVHYATQLIQEYAFFNFNDVLFIIKFFPKQCWSTELSVLNTIDRFLFSTHIDSIERQEMVFKLSNAGFDFSLTPGTKELPPSVRREQITYRVLLTYYDIYLPGDFEFAAIKQQKMLAMALGLKGTSEFLGIQNSQESVLTIGHGLLVEPQTFWSHLIHFYKNFYTPPGHPELLSTQECINQVVDNLPITHENIDINQLLDSFNKNSPIVLPVYVTERVEAHIATVGFLKINDTHYLRVEADKGLGRNEFCVYIVPGDLKDTLLEYANSKSSYYNSYKWESPRSQFEHKIFTAPLKKQKDSFCGRISAEYAFHIAFFLGLISTNLKDSDSEALERACATYYPRARQWFKEFKLSYKKELFEDYEHQLKPYQNHCFFDSAKAQFKKHQKAFASEEMRLCS
jgi:hypothetical protein